VNDEAKRRVGGTSAVDERQETGNVPVDQRPMHPRTREKMYDSLQTATHSSQVQPSVKLRTPSYGEAKRHHKDVVYEEHSNTNVEPTVRGAGTMLATDKQGTGHIPDAQRPTHPTTCKENPPGPQMTTDLFQRESINGPSTQRLEESCGGLQVQRDRGAGNERRSNVNIKHKEKLTMNPKGPRQEGPAYRRRVKD
jgi:hypothetical protein